MVRQKKDSGIQWIGEIPKDWESTKLKNVVSHIDSGGTPTSSNESFYNDNGIPFVNIGDMSTVELLKQTKKHLTEQGVKNKNLKIQPRGTILYSIYATLGKVSELDIPATISQAMLAMSVNEGKVFKSYFKYSLKNLEDYASLVSSGTTQDNISRQKVENFRILLPHIDEQQKIANFLDGNIYKVNFIMEETQASIEEFKKYKQSLIIETVTKGLNTDTEIKDSGVEWIGGIPTKWSCRKIKYVTSISRGKFSHRPRNDERYYDGDYPFIQTGDVARANKYVTSYSQSLNELGKEVSKEFPKGTLVMTIAANIGDIAVLDFDSYFPDSIIGFVPNDGFYWNYLYYIFCAMKETFISTAIVSTQLNLNVERVKELFIPVTHDEEEQRQIAEYLDEKCAHIDSLIEQKQQLVKEFENYKKSLIYEYVTGKKEVL